MSDIKNPYAVALGEIGGKKSFSNRTPEENARRAKLMREGKEKKKYNSSKATQIDPLT